MSFAADKRPSLGRRSGLGGRLPPDKLAGRMNARVQVPGEIGKADLFQELSETGSYTQI